MWCTAKSPTSLAAFLSGACDGEVRVWHLAHRRTLWTAKAHDGFVRGLCVSADGRFFYSCGDDRPFERQPGGRPQHDSFPARRGRR